MERIFVYKIQEKEAGQYLLDFLRAKGYSRHMLTNFKNTPGSLLLNHEKARGHAVLKAGDCIRVRLLDDKASEKIPPVPMPLHILYEDEDILVLNKAADTPIHPSIGNYENTLANGVSWYYTQKGESFVFRCINRLDRDTTGALIVAKNALSAAILSAQMKTRQIHRTYLALAEGKTPLYGTINAPIARMDSSAILREVNYETGEPACTHFQRLGFCNGLSLLELHLETGRTHQIRVHMKHIGFPLTGDFLYHPNFSHIKRQALHSYQLEFKHPITGKSLIFQAPIPEDMKKAFTGDT